MKDTKKVQLLNAFFASVFTTKRGKRYSGGKIVWRKKDFPLVKEDLARDHLGKPDAHKFMSPDGMHP